MKILHIGTYLDGGAGLGMARLHTDLLSQGVDSRILALSTDSTDPRIAGFVPSGKRPNGRIRDLPEKVLHRLGLHDSEFYRACRILSQCSRYPSFRSSPFTRIDICDHPWVKDADIIHLHWIARFLDWRTFFPRIRKPIVWTLRDENPALGVWHYRTDCPESLSNELRTEDSWLRQRKASILRTCRSLSIVSLSTDEDRFFANSEAFSGRSHRVIPNSIDTSLFVRGGGDSVRRELGISSDATVITFVAQYLSEKRKGFTDLVSALSRLNRNDIVVLCVGRPPVPTIQGNARFIPLGLVEDTTRLAQLFSASNLFVSPSMAETFGKTLTEALACGVPVVSYPNSGAKDIVGPEDGELADEFSPNALCRAIQIALDRTFDANLLRARVVSRFSPTSVAKAYIGLYRNISTTIKGTRDPLMPGQT